MRKSLYSSRSLSSIRQSITVILLFSFIGYSILPSHSSASNLTNSSNNLTARAEKNAPQPQKKPDKKDKCPNCSPPGDQTIYIPLADLPEAQGSELVFNSRSPNELEVTPTFYKLDGTIIPGDPVHVQSAEIRYVNFKKLLPAGHRDEHDWGGMSLSFYGGNREMWSQLRFLSVNGGNSVDEFFTVKDESRSVVQEAAWWMPRKSTAIIALGNITDTPTSAIVNFGDGDSQTVSLAPHATEIVRHKHGKEAGPESVAINITGMPGSIIPTGVIASKDGTFNSVIRFYDTKKTKQPHLFANGLRLAGITPHMILRNTSSSPITAQPKFIPLAGVEAAQPVVLPEINLAANETTEVDLTSLLGAVKNRPDLDVVSVQVTNSGEPGSLIGSLYGINSKTGVNYEIPLRDSGPTRSMTGAYPWKITKDYTTIIYITNISDQQAGFVTQINHEGGKFVIDPRKLAPGETAMFDLQKIRDEQTEDNAGRHLPKDTSLGQFKWAVHGVTGGKIALIGRAEMVSRSQHISTSYSCSEACPPTYGGTVNIPTFFFVTASGTATASMTAYYGSGYTTGPYGASATWSIDNSVATVNPSDSASTTTVTGETPGSGNIYADMGLQDWYAYDGLNCIYNGSYPVGDGGPIDVSPQIGSLEPARGLVGSTTEVLITGKFGSSPNPTVQVAGTGVTASVSRSDSVEIRVNFAVAESATAGNHAVTVKINGQTSNSVNFFVQIPSKLVRFSYPGTTNGYGPLVLTSSTNNDVLDLEGNILLPNQCGVYRNLAYQIVDQEGQPIVQEGQSITVAVTETFSNYSGVSTLPGDITRNTSTGLVQDTQYFGKTLPNCLGLNDNETMDQGFKVKIGNTSFPLSTVVHLVRGRFSGIYKIDVTTTTP
jgi:hypothetical protein